MHVRAFFPSLSVKKCVEIKWFQKNGSSSNKIIAEHAITNLATLLNFPKVQGLSENISCNSEILNFPKVQGLSENVSRSGRKRTCAWNKERKMAELKHTQILYFCSDNGHIGTETVSTDIFKLKCRLHMPV